jgi:hypothetical protein
MATKIVFHPIPPAASPVGRAVCSNLLRSLALWIVLFPCSIPAHPQFQSALVFAADPKGVAVYTRNDVTGILTAVPGSPFPSKEPVNVMALDFSGRFLFTACDNPSKISMFTVDQNTGALQEVPKSPFASPSTNSPVFLSTESSGQFLYVINFNSSQPNASSVESFQIDPVNLDLIPSSSEATQLPGLFLSGATHPSGKSFYALLNIPNSSIPSQAVFLLFDGSTGAFTTLANAFGCCFALDPQGKSLALEVSSLFTLYSLQADGTVAPNPATVSPNGALSMAFDTFGRFLYEDLKEPSGTSTSVHIFSVATLQETANSPLPSSFQSSGTWIVDPTAPFIYADQVYQVDPQTGIPSPILSASPVVKPAIFSRPPGSQPVLGPIAELSATSLSFGSLSLGQTSSAQALTITSDGGQALRLNTLAITGANPGDFAETNTCHVPNVLQPGNSCSVLVSFTPSAAGSRTAALTITSNASPPTESAQMNGTGLSPAPAVTLVPGSLNFGTATMGSSTPMNITVTNAGTAALHITNVALGGANTNDFSFSDLACNSAIPVNASCLITVTFTPLAAGLRTASVMLADDAPDSPQVIGVKGNANAAPSSAVTVNPGSPDFGTTTQGTSTPMNVTVKNTGTAALHITSVALGGANGNEFSFTDPACNAAIPVSGTCTIALTFTPFSVGAHMASLSLIDDAPDSPQTVQVKGNANAAFSAGTAQGGSMTVSVSAGQTAQYQMQLTPGPGYSGSVSLACSGAPLGATCQVPASVSIANGLPAPFTVTVSTSGGAMVPPAIPRRFVPPAGIRVLLLLALALVLLRATKYRWIFDNALGPRRLAWSGALNAIFLCSVIYAAGCGAGSTTVVPPPPVVTPPGTSTITVTMSAMSSSGKPLQLQPLQLTLTVK